jgi:hypothetical protein
LDSLTIRAATKPIGSAHQVFWSGYEPHVSERLLTDAGLVIEPATVETADEDGDPVSFLWVEARRS